MDEIIPLIPALARAIAKSFLIYSCVVLLLCMVERRWPAGPFANLRDQIFNFILAFLVAVLLTAVNVLLPVAEFISRHAGVEIQFLRGWTPQTVTGWLAGALCYALIWDFLQYWFHRLQHSFTPFWFLHALHHDSTALNSTDAIRNTLWAGVLQGIFIGVPMTLIGANHLLHVHAGLVLFSVWGFYNHANIRVSHGPLTPIISGPQFHRIHHGVDPQYHDKNFAAFFPVIDVVLGTYKAPAAGLFPATGLADRPQARGGPKAVLVAMLGR